MDVKRTLWASALADAKTDVAKLTCATTGAGYPSTVEGTAR